MSAKNRDSGILVMEEDEILYGIKILRAIRPLSFFMLKQKKKAEKKPIIIVKPKGE